MGVEVESGVAGGKGHNEDVDLPVIKQIIFQWSRHHFQLVLGADTHSIDLDQRVRDDGVELSWGGDGSGGGLEEVLAKLAPERVEEQFGSGLASRILDDVGRVKGDTLALTVVSHEGSFLFWRLGPGRITRGLLFNAQLSVDILSKESPTTLSMWEMPHFMDPDDLVPLFDCFQQFGGAPGTSEETFGIVVRTTRGTLQQRPRRYDTRGR